MERKDSVEPAWNLLVGGRRIEWAARRRMKSGESVLSGRAANALAQAERTFDGRAAEKVCHQHFGNDLAEAGAVGWLAVDIEKFMGFIRACMRRTRKLETLP